MIPPKNPIYTTLVSQLETLQSQEKPTLTRTHALALKSFLDSKEILSKAELLNLRNLLTAIASVTEEYNVGDLFNRLYAPSQEKTCDLYQKSLEKTQTSLASFTFPVIEPPPSSNSSSIKESNQAISEVTEKSPGNVKKTTSAVKRSSIKITKPEQSTIQDLVPSKKITNQFRYLTGQEKLTDISFNSLKSEKTDPYENSTNCELLLTAIRYLEHVPPSSHKINPFHLQIKELQDLLKTELEKKSNENQFPALKTILQIFSKTNLLFLGEIITDLGSKECRAILSTIENDSELKNLLSPGEQNLIESIKTIKLSDSKDILTLGTEELDLSKKCTTVSEETERPLLPDIEQKLTTLLSKKNTYSGFYAARYTETLLLEAQDFFTKKATMAKYRKKPSQKTKTSKHTSALLSKRLNKELSVVKEALTDT